MVVDKACDGEGVHHAERKVALLVSQNAHRIAVLRSTAPNSIDCLVRSAVKISKDVDRWKRVNQSTARMIVFRIVN